MKNLVTLLILITAIFNFSKSSAQPISSGIAPPSSMYKVGKLTTMIQNHDHARRKAARLNADLIIYNPELGTEITYNESGLKISESPFFAHRYTFYKEYDERQYEAALKKSSRSWAKLAKENTKRSQEYIRNNNTRFEQEPFVAKEIPGIPSGPVFWNVIEHGSLTELEDSLYLLGYDLIQAGQYFMESADHQRALTLAKERSYNYITIGSYEVGNDSYVKYSFYYSSEFPEVNRTKNVLDIQVKSIPFSREIIFYSENTCNKNRTLSLAKFPDFGLISDTLGIPIDFGYELIEKKRTIELNSSDVVDIYGTANYAVKWKDCTSLNIVIKYDDLQVGESQHLYLFKGGFLKRSFTITRTGDVDFLIDGKPLEPAEYDPTHIINLAVKYWMAYWNDHFMDLGNGISSEPAWVQVLIKQVTFLDGNIIMSHGNASYTRNYKYSDIDIWRKGVDFKSYDFTLFIRFNKDYSVDFHLEETYKVDQEKKDYFKYFDLNRAEELVYDRSASYQHMNLIKNEK